MLFKMINSMVEESNVCTCIIKKGFNKKMVMTKGYDEDFETSTKRWISYYNYVVLRMMLKSEIIVISLKNIEALHIDCNIKDKLNHKILVVLHNLKNYVWHLVMQKLDKFNFKMNVIWNGLKKHTSFNINNKLIFIDSSHKVIKIKVLDFFLMSIRGVLEILKKKNAKQIKFL